MNLVTKTNEIIDALKDWGKFELVDKEPPPSINFVTIFSNQEVL